MLIIMSIMVLAIRIIIVMFIRRMIIIVTMRLNM